MYIVAGRVLGKSNRTFREKSQNVNPRFSGWFLELSVADTKDSASWLSTNHDQLSNPTPYTIWWLYILRALAVLTGRIQVLCYERLHGNQWPLYRLRDILDSQKTSINTVGYIWYRTRQTRRMMNYNERFKRNEHEMPWELTLSIPKRYDMSTF